MVKSRLFTCGPPVDGVSDEYEMDSPESLFHRAMVSLYDFVLLERRYDANRFLRLLVAQAGVMTAKDLLSAPSFGVGFEGIWQRGPLEKTMEYLVLQPKFFGLFTEEERETARSRLRECGYIPDSAEEQIFTPSPETSEIPLPGVREICP
jgi:hypothetical protein